MTPVSPFVVLNSQMADNKPFVRVFLLGLLSINLFFLCLVNCTFVTTKYTHYED